LVPLPYAISLRDSLYQQAKKQKRQGLAAPKVLESAAGTRKKPGEFAPSKTKVV